jgi:hypothetical protein
MGSLPPYERPSYVAFGAGAGAGRGETDLRKHAGKVNTVASKDSRVIR